MHLLKDDRTTLCPVWLHTSELTVYFCRQAEKQLQGGTSKLPVVEWIPKPAVLVLVDLMSVICSRPKGMFKDCTLRINSGLNLVNGIPTSLIYTVVCKYYPSCKLLLMLPKRECLAVLIFLTFCCEGELKMLGITMKISGM